MRIVVQPSALADVGRGYKFYERKERGLGGYFLDSIYSDIDSLQLFAGVHSVHFERYYRLLCKRFPYAVYYQVSDDTARVRAVLDLRMNPERIARKLTSLA